MSDEELCAVLYTLGPASISLNTGNGEEFAFVKDEFNGPCGPKTEKRSFTLVGYTKHHWILKNSWGSNWGQNGFFKVKRGENKCSINKQITIPFVN